MQEVSPDEHGSLAPLTENNFGERESSYYIEVPAKQNSPGRRRMVSEAA
jgi:hypothetical protein